MKKTLRMLPLVAIGLMVVLAFTGCDKILEMVFPDQTDQGGGGDTYTVVFNVYLPTATIPDWNQNAIVVKILGPDGYEDVRRSLARPPAQPGGDATMMARFENLPSGGYQAFAWLDMNGNGQPDPIEPYGVVEGGREYFGLPEGDSRTSAFTISLVVPDISGGNSVTATVKVPRSIAGWDAPNALMMTLENLDGVSIYLPNRRATATPDTDPAMGRFMFVYDGLPGGSYRAYAWLDLNFNLTRDPEEPQGVPGQEFFGLPINGTDERAFDIMLVVPDTSGQNTVIATVRISTGIPGWNSPNWLMVMLEKQDGSQIYQPARRTTAVMDTMDPAKGVGTFTYHNVPGGYYRAFGWLDINGDGQPTLNQAGVNEPFGVPNTNEYFSLPSTGATTIYLSVDVVLAATGTATMNWNVHVDQAIAGWNSADAVKVTLERADGSPVADASRSATAAYDTMYPAYGRAPFVFGQLAEGTYRATVWVDANFNWIKEPAEFGQVTTDIWVSQGATVYQDVWIYNVVTYSDIYEPDNTYDVSQYLWVNDAAQVRYLDPGDQDWIYFWADAGWNYVIQTHSADTSSTDTVLELFGQDGITQLLINDDYESLFSRIGPWTAPVSGYYYLRVTGYAGNATGSYTIDVILQ